MMKTERRADTGIVKAGEFLLKGAAAVRGSYRLTGTLVMAFAVIASLVSCQEFFTSSFATVLARDSYPIPDDMSVEDAIEYLELANGDPVIAAALVTPLYAAASSADPASDDYDEAAAALVNAVVLSSGASPAIFSIVEDVGIENFESLDAAQIDAALATLMTISLSDEEAAALALVSGNPAPDGATPDQLFIAAFTLAIDAFNDGGASTTDLDTWLGGGALPGTVDSDSVDDAMDLLALAQAADPGNASIFGQLMSSLSFD
jgi:hypothetical protein